MLKCDRVAGVQTAYVLPMPAAHSRIDKANEQSAVVLRMPTLAHATQSRVTV